MGNYPARPAGMTPLEAWGPLGPPTLMEGESLVAYEEILSRIELALRPADILEEIFVRDVADLVWDALRLRRLKGNVMRVTVQQGLERVLERIIERRTRQAAKANPGAAGVEPLPSAWDLAGKWAKRDRAAIEMVEGLLDSAHQGIHGVTAHAVAGRINDIECIDRMTAAAEIRRIAALNEIDRNRARRAGTIKDVVHEVLDRERHGGRVGSAGLRALEAQPTAAGAS